jgi:SAM-dependent methyltransferase
MPSLRPLRQPQRLPLGWLDGPSGRQLLDAVQHLAIPELTRVFGNCGLYLRPLSGIAPELSGNMLSQVVSLYRDGHRFGGQARCEDDEMPFASARLSLVYACFVLESSPAPQVLLAEIHRMLKPEGVAMMFGLNPWSPCVLRHSRSGARLHGVGTVEAMARQAGLELMSRHYLGPCRPGGSNAMGNGWWDSLRTSYLVLLRRRDATLTPLRKSSAAASLRPGVSLG